MAKATDEIREARELEREAREVLVGAFSSMFEIGERVVCTMHSGATHDGTVEDANLAGLLVRDAGGRLFFVAFAGIESAEIFEAEDPGDGDDVEEERESVEAKGPELVTDDEPVESDETRAA